MKLNILYLEDNKNRYKTHVRLLEVKGYKVLHYTNSDELIEDMKEGRVHYDLAIVDFNTEGSRTDGREVLKLSKKIDKEIPVYACTEYHIENRKDFDGIIMNSVFQSQLEDVVKKHFK